MIDILEELLEAGYVSPPRNPNDYTKMVSCGLLVRAADEIAKLRERVAALDTDGRNDAADAIRARSNS